MPLSTRKQTGMSGISPAPDQPWHSLPGERVFELLETTPQGLSEAQARHRRTTCGPNRLTTRKRKSAWIRFLEQFHNVFIYALLIAGLTTAILGHWLDSTVIFGVVFINALIGFIQEGKAEQALDAIRHLLSQQAMVLRDGTAVLIPAEELVPGDVVLLQAGDKVPADLRLFSCRELKIDESLLTGESESARKSTDPVPATAAVGDRRCLAFSGTLVTYGHGQGVVVATGDNTEIGRVSGMLESVETLTTPLLRKMAVFTKWLTLAIGLVAVVTGTYGVLIQGYSLSEMFLAAVSVAVAGIPEGLPPVMTITLAIGVQRMARRNAIIRRLPAVETLGSVTVICSDKTGTLTRNEMTVQSVLTRDGLWSVSGVGYDPHGSFSRNGDTITAPLSDPLLKETAQAALLCNDAAIYEENGHWRLRGDPTEGALVTLAVKAGLDPYQCRTQYPRCDAIPFESEHQFMATLHHDHTGHGCIYVKGAPERILEMCRDERITGGDRPVDHAYWQQHAEALASRGQRLLALACKAVPATRNTLQFDDVRHDLVLLGIVGMIDPPRPEAVRAVQACRNAGIRVKMITGDHAVTARAIATQMGISDHADAITGTQLQTHSDSSLRRIVRDGDVFARVSPEQKLLIVTALQQENDIVAMTGDGVNDAPALKRADVGVAMGRNGTEVAKEVADVVLTDDNFASIARAVEEGRTVYDNLKKSILFILPTSVGEALTLLTAIMAGQLLPITPVQVLWINMITAVTLGLTLAFEPAESDVMRRPPRAPQEPILSAHLIWRTLFVAIILVIGTFGVFYWLVAQQNAPIEYARTAAVNVLVLSEVFYLFSARSILAPALTRRGLTGNRSIYYAIAVLLGMQAVFTYWPPMQNLFATTALQASTMLVITAVASSVLILVEIEKAIIRRKSTA